MCGPGGRLTTVDDPDSDEPGFCSQRSVISEVVFSGAAAKALG
jgi:hypothetical protein